jgi:hypothetical protein
LNNFFILFLQIKMAKDKYIAVSGLSLTPNSIKKMHKHQATLLKPAHMTGGEMEIFVSPMKAKRMMSAVKKGKGMKLCMTPDEMEHTMKHGKGVMLPSRKIFKVAKEGMPVLASKGVITHNAPVASVNAGNDTFQVVRGDPTAPAPKKRASKKMAEDTEGGRVRMPKLKDIGRAVKKGFDKVTSEYKEFRDDPKNATARKMIQEGAKQAIKAGIVSGATALGSTVGAPQLGAVAGVAADPIAKLAIEKIGLGRGFMLNSNYNNFLNPLHPAMSPTLPAGDNSLTRGGSFRSAGYGMCGTGRLRGHGVPSISNIQPLGSAMNPQLPPVDHSIGR